MKKLSNERHLKVVIVLIPCKEEVYPWVYDQSQAWSSSRQPSGFADALEEVTRHQGIGFLDLKPYLIDAARSSYEESGQLLYWHDDSHFNPSGHRIAASIIYRELLSPNAAVDHPVQATPGDATLPRADGSPIKP